MNTHSDGLYVNTYTHVKDEDFSLNVWSQLRQLWTNQIVGWMESKWDKQGGVCSLSHYTSVHSYHASSFIKLYKKHSLYKKRGIYTMKYSMYKQ